MADAHSRRKTENSLFRIHDINSLEETNCWTFAATMNLYTVYSTSEDLLKKVAIHQQSLRGIYKYDNKGPRKRQDLPKYYQSPEKIFGQTTIAPGDPLADAIPDRQEFLAKSDRTNGLRLLRHVEYSIIGT